MYGSNLVKAGDPLLVMTRETARGKGLPDFPTIEALMEGSTAQGLILARPAEPYFTIAGYLADHAQDAVIRPEDSETRMFLGNLPVVRNFSPGPLEKALAGKKCLIIPGHGILAIGAGTLKDAYTAFAAACFACFVKFFADFAAAARQSETTPDQRRAFSACIGHLPPEPVFDGGLLPGPFESEEQVCAAMAEAGSRMVSLGLVDACFGNISYRLGNRIYISRTGSFLDELQNDIATCSMDDPVCVGGRPSSEYPAHREILRDTPFTGILHGHPLFSVIMSMDCDADCDHRGDCHRYCPRCREIHGTPVVSGETGGGRYGLSRTVPGMIRQNKGVIVHGHGVFTAATADYNDALARMAGIEQMCRREYFNGIRRSGASPA